MKRTALVTGAASGLGALAAQRLAAAAWDVVAVDVDEAGLARTALRSSGIHVRVCDVDDAGAVHDLVAEAGAVHRVLHTGASGGTERAERAERAERLGYLGAVHVVGATLPGMLERGRGELVVFSPPPPPPPGPGSPGLEAARAAVAAYTAALAREHAGRGVRIRHMPAHRAHTAPPRAVLDAVERSLARGDGAPAALPGVLRRVLARAATPR